MNKSNIIGLVITIALYTGLVILHGLEKGTIAFSISGLLGVWMGTMIWSK